MDASFHVGQKVIYYKRGRNHVESMNRYIGQVLTIGNIYYDDGIPTHAQMKEAKDGWYFTLDSLKPIASKIR